MNEDMASTAMPDRKDKAGNAWKGEGRPEYGKGGQRQNDIQNKGNISNDPCGPVIKDHKTDDQCRADQSGDNPLPDGVLPEGRPTVLCSMILTGRAMTRP